MILKMMVLLIKVTLINYKNDHNQMISLSNTGKLSNPSGVNLNMTNNKIINLKYPQSNSDTCNKSYVDNNITNVNTKITNVVLHITETENKLRKDVEYFQNIFDDNFDDNFLALSLLSIKTTFCLFLMFSIVLQLPI